MSERRAAGPSTCDDEDVVGPDLPAAVGARLAMAGPLKGPAIYRSGGDAAVPQTAVSPSRRLPQDGGGRSGSRPSEKIS